MSREEIEELAARIEDAVFDAGYSIKGSELRALLLEELKEPLEHQPPNDKAQRPGHRDAGQT